MYVGEKEKKLNRFVLITKWQSLMIYSAKLVTDSLLKNNGPNISVLVNICIEKSMDTGQPIFHKEN